MHYQPVNLISIKLCDMKKAKVKAKDKVIEQEAVLQLLQEFINDSASGRRSKRNGKPLSNGTIANYEYFQNNFCGFVELATFDIKIFQVSNLTQSEKERAKRYYQKLYKGFTNYLYDEKKCYDNYVGLMVKCLRSFFNYLERDRIISVGSYHKQFYVPSEEIPIVALNQEQLNYIISDSAFNEIVKREGLEVIRDIFVLGCTVALRISDLLSLSRKNLIVTNNNYYLNVKSKKTGTHTSIKLPAYAIEIIKKYQKGNQSKLLPSISKAWFNNQLKEMAQMIPNNFEMIKVRERRGKQIVVYKDIRSKTHYKLSDHITTHTMRRTAITTMLSLGMPEHLVRQISGHAPNSKEFYRYVRLSQSIIDDETDRIFNKIAG